MLVCCRHVFALEYPDLLCFVVFFFSFSRTTTFASGFVSVFYLFEATTPQSQWNKYKAIKLSDCNNLLFGLVAKKYIELKFQECIDNFIASTLPHRPRKGKRDIHINSIQLDCIALNWINVMFPEKESMHLRHLPLTSLGFLSILPQFIEMSLDREIKKPRTLIEFAQKRYRRMIWQFSLVAVLFSVEG